MTSVVNGAFPQTSASYINSRQPLRLQLFKQYEAKIKKAKADAEGQSDKEKEQIRRTIKFSSDNGFGYNSSNNLNPLSKTDNDTNLWNYETPQTTPFPT